MAKDAEQEREELALLEATIAKLRTLGGRFPLSEETAALIWQTTSPTPTTAAFQKRMAELVGDEPPSEGKVTTGSTLRRWREAAGLSIRDLAGRIGVADQVVAELEGGAHPAQRPPEFWEKLAAALPVERRTLAQLLRGGLATPVTRHGMTAARSDDIDAGQRRAWLEVSDTEVDARARERLEEAIRRLEA